MLTEFFKKIEKEKGTAYFVGGYVRDFLLNIPNNDIDIEVFGISLENLEAILKECFSFVDYVGKQYGGFKVRDDKVEYDISIPRREQKNGESHKEFDVTLDPFMSISEAQKRRNYTINAIYRNCHTLEIVDHFGGQQDLDRKVLRHVSDRFAEDPLRPLIGFQLCARYNLEADTETIKLCQQMADPYIYCALPKSRIWGEWEKFFTKGIFSHRGIDFLIKTGWIRFYPELENLINCPQNSQWHSEGDVMTHTKIVTATIATTLHSLSKSKKYSYTRKEQIELIVAALAHDMGKPETTALQIKLDKDYVQYPLTKLRELMVLNNFNELSRIFNNPEIKWVSHTHEQKIETIRNFFNNIGLPGKYRENVEKMVFNHMFLTGISGSVTKRQVRRLLFRLKDIKFEQVILLMRGDILGSQAIDETHTKENLKKLKKVEEIGREILSEEKIRPILRGQHLINMGHQEGPQIGRILKEAQEAQIEGEFSDEESGLKWLENYLINL